MDTLFLTADEKKLYDKLPADVKKAWGGKVELEKGTAWETGKDLENMRKAAVSRGLPKEVKSLSRKINTRSKLGLDLSTIDLENIPQDYLPTFFALMGAVGVSYFIALELSNNDNKDLSDLAALASIRHTILEVNSSNV